MKIAICVPVHGDTKALFTLSLSALLFKTAKSTTDDLLVDLYQDSVLPASRNRLVDRAQGWGADWLLWLDADHVFPADALIRLLAHEKPIVGCNYPQRWRPTLPTAVKDGRHVHTRKGLTGLERVDSLGLGVCLMSMGVFDNLERPYFAFEAKPGQSTFISEDVAFFRKVGVPAFVDHGLSLEIGHIAEQVLMNSNSGSEHVTSSILAPAGDQ